MAYQYLFDPNKQFQNVSGVNNVAGFLRVFYNGTDDRPVTYKDFNGTANPADIPIDNNGRAVVIVNEDMVYRLEVYNRDGALLWSQYPLVPMGGEGSGGLTPDDIKTLILKKYGEEVGTYNPAWLHPTQIDIEGGIVIVADLFGSGKLDNDKFQKIETAINDSNPVFLNVASGSSSTFYAMWKVDAGGYVFIRSMDDRIRFLTVASQTMDADGNHQLSYEDKMFTDVIFVAQVGTTTFDEIRTAKAAGKLCVANSAGNILQLVHTNNSEFCFGSVYFTAGRPHFVGANVLSDDQWSTSADGFNGIVKISNGINAYDECIDALNRNKLPLLEYYDSDIGEYILLYPTNPLNDQLPQTPGLAFSALIRQDANSTPAGMEYFLLSVKLFQGFVASLPEKIRFTGKVIKVGDFSPELFSIITTGLTDSVDYGGNCFTLHYGQYFMPITRSEAHHLYFECLAYDQPLIITVDFKDDGTYSTSYRPIWKSVYSLASTRCIRLSDDKFPFTLRYKPNGSNTEYKVHISGTSLDPVATLEVEGDRLYQSSAAPVLYSCNGSSPIYPYAYIHIPVDCACRFDSIKDPELANYPVEVVDVSSIEPSFHTVPIIGPTDYLQNDIIVQTNGLTVPGVVKNLPEGYDWLTIKHKDGYAGRIDILPDGSVYTRYHRSNVIRVSSAQNVVLSIDTTGGNSVHLRNSLIKAMIRYSDGSGNEHLSEFAIMFNGTSRITALPAITAKYISNPIGDPGTDTVYAELVNGVLSIGFKCTHSSGELVVLDIYSENALLWNIKNGVQADVPIPTQAEFPILNYNTLTSSLSASSSATTFTANQLGRLSDIYYMNRSTSGNDVTGGGMIVKVSLMAPSKIYKFVGLGQITYGNTNGVVKFVNDLGDGTSIVLRKGSVRSSLADGSSVAVLASEVRLNSPIIAYYVPGTTPLLSIQFDSP